MIKSNLMKKAVTIFTLLLSLSMSASNVRKFIPLKQDGDPEPPGTPVDGYLYVLIIAAIAFAGVCFYRKFTAKTN